MAQREGNYRNNKFTFGYLNTAQDRNDVERPGLTRLEGVDLDALALGVVKGSNYTDAGHGLRDFRSCQVVGDNFGLISQYEYSVDSYTTVESPVVHEDYEAWDNGWVGVRIRKDDQPVRTLTTCNFVYNNYNNSVICYATLEYYKGDWDDGATYSDSVSHLVWNGSTLGWVQFSFNPGPMEPVDVFIGLNELSDVIGDGSSGGSVTVSNRYFGLAYENDSGTLFAIDKYLRKPDPPSLSIATSQGGVSIAETVEWVGFGMDDVSVVIGENGSMPDINGMVTINPALYNQTTRSFSYQIRVRDDEVSFERKIGGGVWGGNYPISGIDGDNVGYSNVDHGVYIAMDSSYTYNAGDMFTFSISNNVLEDGDYHYLVSSVVKEGASEVESVYSQSVRIAISNEDYLGKQIAYNKAEIKVERDAVAEKWVYRIGPRDDEWSRIAKVLPIPFDDPSDTEYVFVDDVSIASVIDAKIINDINIESVSDIMASVGATSISHMFEKDNRLWIIPKEKQDVMFFSEPLEWWRWKRTNSIGFNGDFKGIEHIRDDKNVSVQNTAAVVTSQGLYNVYGSGVDDDKYVRIEHERSFSAIDNTLVKANNVLYMMSDGDDYEDGEWGRKLYSYDLTSLKELSATVKGSEPFLNNNSDVLYINQIAGNKLKIMLDNNGKMMIYHIQGEGFGESSEYTESADEWFIETKTEYPNNSYAGKFGDADRIRFEYSGEIDVTWVVDGNDQPTITLPNAQRGLPIELATDQAFGMNYSLKLHGKNGAILYDMYMVKEK